MAIVKPAENTGLGQKKTILIMVTVVGCIAILWPKVFHPIMFNAATTKPVKEHRGGAGCCNVVLDNDIYSNSSDKLGACPGYRKRLTLISDEISIRQERPSHLHPDLMHPAMKEKGRHIPATQTVPIVQKAHSPSMPPRIIDGRPSPIPAMRPPMGAGANQQPQQKMNSMGFIMPLYTIGIVSFFIYTIIKMLSKKPIPAPVYSEPLMQPDPLFRNKVFNQSNGSQNGKKPQPEGKIGTYNSNNTNNSIDDNINEKVISNLQASCYQPLIDDKIVMHLKTDDQLMELNLLRKKLQETENAMAKIIAQMGNASLKPKGLIDATDVQLTRRENSVKLSKELEQTAEKSNGIVTSTESEVKESSDDQSKEIKLEKEIEKSKLKIVGMETTSSNEGGKKWNRPETPTPTTTLSEDKEIEDEKEEPVSIYLEGSLPHESQILVSDSEVTEEETNDDDCEYDQPAVILSSKVTLSLISLDRNNVEGNTSDIEHSDRKTTTIAK